MTRLMGRLIEFAGSRGARPAYGRPSRGVCRPRDCRPWTLLARLRRARTFFAVVVAFAALAPREAHAVTLLSSSFDDSGVEAVLMLRFDAEPPVRYTPLTDSRMLLLDFMGAVIQSGREKVAPRSGLVEHLSMAQFDRDRLRLVLKVRPGTVVNVYRYPVPGWREVRFAVVVERETSFDRLPPLPGRKTRPRIVFDPGHGGHDYGAIGSVTSDKEVALAVGRELKKLFDADRRVEVFFTRLSDHFVPLDTRTLFAHRVDADLFVSLHANSMIRDSWTKGIEVWYLSERGAAKEMARVLEEKGLVVPGGRRGRRVASPTASVDQIILSMQQNRTIAQSSLAARILNRDLVRWTGQETRGVKRSSFRVLRPIEIPSCLIEFGFLSNSAEERYMVRWGYARKAALAIYRGVLEWMARTGRLQGAAARGLIQADVSADEVGEESRPGLEADGEIERMRVGEGVEDQLSSRARQPARPMAGRAGAHIDPGTAVPGPCSPAFGGLAPARAVALATDNPVSRARARLARLRREGRD